MRSPSLLLGWPQDAIRHENCDCDGLWGKMPAAFALFRPLARTLRQFAFYFED
jgi:hypothetical protein